MPTKCQPVTKLKRGLDPERSAQVILVLNQKQIELVNNLLATGVWGNSAAQVVMRLFDSACLPHLTTALAALPDR